MRAIASSITPSKKGKRDNKGANGPETEVDKEQMLWQAPGRVYRKRRFKSRKTSPTSAEDTDADLQAASCQSECC